jgi:DNA-binding transcriptional LysR family regulator
VPRSVVPILLEPLVASFCQAFPEVEVELAASEELVDLAAGGFDAGIRMGQFISPDMVAVRLTKPLPLIVVGSPAYLARRGRPARPEDLREHACLRLRRSNGALASWSLNDNGRSIEIVVSGPFIAYDFPTMLGAAIEGVGLAQVPGPLASGAIAAGKLVHVMADLSPMTPGVFLYYPGHRQIMPKLRAFIDHVKGRSGVAA